MMASSSDTSHHTIHIPNSDIVVQNHPMVSLFSIILSCVKRFVMILSGFVTRFVMILVVSVCSIVAAIVALPLLLAAFVITRVLQFIYGCGYVYDKATKLKVLIKLKLFLRTWLYLVNLYLMCWVVILYGVAHVPHLGLKDVFVLRYSILHWIETYFFFFGICSLSYILSIISIRFVMFCIPLEYHTFKSGSLVVSDTVHEIIDCFILLLFAEHVIVMHIHSLKEFELLGFYPAHRLFHVLVLLLVFHDLIGLSTQVLVWWLHKLVANPGSDPNSVRYVITTKFIGRESIVYWVDGLKPSIMFTFSSLMLLIAWVSYFGHLIEKHEHDHGLESFRGTATKVLKVGTWTTLCLFFFSVFWLIKTCILLELENRIVYKKFGRKISKEGKHLYFLGVLGRGLNHSYDFLQLQYVAKSSSARSSSQTPGQGDQKSEQNQSRKSGGCVHGIKKAFNWEITKEPFNTGFTKGRRVSLLMLSIFPIFLIKENARYQHHSDPEDNLGEPKPKGHEVKKLCVERKKQAKEDLLMEQSDHTLVLYELQKKVQYFLGAKETLSQDKYTSQMLIYLKRDGIDDGTIEKTLKRLINDSEFGPNNKMDSAKEAIHDWDSFRKIIDEQAEDPSTKYVERLETWLEEAHNRCVVLANTLSSAKELVECLDTIMSVLLIILAFIVWLLLTGLTTTKGIVLIGSPIVAFSFIFGNTCNIFFQGIIFVYAIHPFDVGDLCVIENNMLEVITIGVWKTTFSKIDTAEEVIYPNSDLMNKNIINHKTEFDWNESVEIYEDSLNREKIIHLKQEIEKELKDDTKYECKPRGTVEVMKTAENKMKIVVNFRYNAKVIQKKSMTYFECLRKKRKLRTEFLQKFVFEDQMKDSNKEPKIQDPEIQAS